MAKLVARGQYTLVHLHDGKNMQMYLKSNMPTTQHFSLTNRNYSPDYTQSPIVITPELYFSGSEENQIAHIKDVVWKINNEIPIQYGGVVSFKAPYTLTINKNLVSTPQLKIEFSCVVVDPDTKLEVKQNASISFTKQDVDSFTPMMLLTTPEGNLFKNELHDSLTAVCKLMVGTKDISTDLEHVWYAVNSKGQFERLVDNFYVSGQGTETLTVKSAYITTETSFKCEIVYAGSLYTEFVTFSKHIDPYFLKIENKNGDKMKNGQGIIYCEAHLIRGNVQVPDAKAESMFNFQWKKFNKYTGEEDKTWRNPTARMIELTKEDIDTLSTFTCEVTTKNGFFPYTLPLILN